MQRENLAYEWNDVALLVDQRAYTVICKTLLRFPKQEMTEIQDVILSDWTWQSEQRCSDDKNLDGMPFQGTVTLQICYLNQDLQREAFFVDVPIQGIWQEQMTQQNDMRMVFYHTHILEEQFLLETVLQIGRNHPLEHTQVLLGHFQVEEQLILDEPWPACDSLLVTSVLLEIQAWEIAAKELRLEGAYQIVLVYQSARQPGEQVFVYEKQIPMETTIVIPEGLHTLNGIMPYYQSLTAQQTDERQIELLGSGVFCTLPADAMQTIIEDEIENKKSSAVDNGIDDTIDGIIRQPRPHTLSPSVVNQRGSRRANLSKYMRDLNNSMETPTSVRNFEINIDRE